ARYRLNLALAYGLADDEQQASVTARQVLDEASVKNNLAYYALLRAMDPKARSVAVLSAQLHGTALPAPTPTAASPAVAPPSHPATPTPAVRPVTASAPASSARAEIAKPPRPEAQAAGQDF